MEDNTDHETKVQIIQSSCLFNKQLNKNNAIDGSNIVYLAGASIVFHNIFQNTKKFINRISDSQVIGIAFFKSSQNAVALATKTSISQEKKLSKINIELYFASQQAILLSQLSDSIQFIDMEFMDKKKIIMLGKESDTYFFYILNHDKKLKKKEVHLQNPKKFISQDRRISVLGNYGLKQIECEVDNLSPDLRFPELKIDDYAIIDNEFQILLSQNELHCYHDLQKIQVISLSDHFQEQIKASSIVKVGRNLLAAYENTLTISHFIIQNSKLKFLNNFAYKQRLKGGILSMQVSFDEMHMAMSVKILQKDIVKMENFMFNLSILSSQKKFVNPFIRMIPLGTQSGQIISLQSIVPFQTFHLVGNSIVNYSYIDHIQKKAKYFLHQTPKQIAVHPLGHQFFCLFDSQVKFYNRIQNQLIQIWNQQIICSSAKYTSCGLLLMSCLQDSYYQIILYDTNSLKRLKTIPNINLRYPVSRIQLAEQDSQIVLYMGNDLSVFKLKNGQKVAQHKQRKQQIVSISYDPTWMSLISSTSKKTLKYCKKFQQQNYNFTFQKIIDIDEQITFIHINPIIETVFMGTKSGKLIWAQYPLNLIQSEGGKATIQYRQIKLHHNSVNSMFLTNNLKYLFVTFKDDGIVICKIKKLLKYESNSKYNEYDISNLNFIQTSSKNFLDVGYEKLKILLQKRKAVFNELDQFKKEWQMKRNKTIKKIQNSNKQKELIHVNTALQKVNQLKQEKKRCYQILEQLQLQTKMFTKQQQQKYQREILLYYDQNVNLRTKKERLRIKCQEEFAKIQQTCSQNISEIDDQLKEKYKIFMENYQEMKKNLHLYEKRLNIQEEEVKQIRLQLFSQKMTKLKEQESNLSRKSNQLKAFITKYKKQSERYMTRRYFLQSKKNFFIEQLQFCRQQKQELNDLKSDLQDQLKQLQNLTNKKQKRLRKYFKQNQILVKYQMIHNNLINSLNGEVQFLDDQKLKASKDIVSVQKELSTAAQNNQTYSQKILNKGKQVQKMKNKKYFLMEKTRYLTLIIQEMSQAIQSIKGSLNEQNKANLFGAIYKQFYIDRKLQKIIQNNQSVNSVQQEEEMEYKIFNTALNKKKVLENLQNQKQYLQTNMNLFSKHNLKTDEQMNLNFLKYQTQNYNLIAQCNIRKQQTIKKKRILHELIDSVKETQVYMNQLQKQNIDDIRFSKSSSVVKSSNSIPFILYKQNKEQQQKNRSKHLRKESSQPTFWKSNLKKSTYQVRKMLDIQKCGQSKEKVQRNIKTAMIKNRFNFNNNSTDTMGEIAYPIQQYENIKKPLTATGKRHHMPFGQVFTSNKVKSTSKPTTCTTHSKHTSHGYRQNPNSYFS